MRLLLLSVILPIVFGGAIPGQEKCAWGPTYWCSHVSHARECSATQHCLQTVWKNQIIKPTSTATCTYCQLIVNGMKDAFNSKAAQADAADVLSRVCVFIPESDARDMCKGLVTENVQVLIEMFENDISTDMVCATLGLCSGLEDTWSPYGVKASNTTDCGDCKKFITDLQQSIISKEMINQLEQLLNQTLCSQLGGFSAECNDLVKQFLPAVLQTMADEIDPDIVCRMLGFCTADGKQLAVLKIKNIFANRKSKGPLRYRSSEECEICKDFVIQIDGLLNDTTTQDKVKYELKTVVCTLVGSLEDECKELVDQYLPWLFDLLLSELDPTTLCEAAGVCTVPSGSKVPHAKYVQPAAMVGPGFVHGTRECEICKFIVQTVDTFLEENKTITTLEGFVDDICRKLVTPQLANECEAFVEEYGQLVLGLLAKELDPNVICGKIDLCKKSMVTVQKLKGDGMCQVCMLIVNEIDAALANVSTADITKDLQTLCDYLPSSLSKACIRYVDDYAALVIDLIKSENPRKLCSLAQMCNGTVGSHMNKIIPEKQPIKSDEICQVCDTVIVGLKIFVGDNATKEELKTAVENLCKELPNIGDVCNQFIKQYGDRIIDLILEKLQPFQICTELGLCTPADKMAAVSVVMSPYDTLPLVQPTQDKIGLQNTGNVIECKMCTKFMNYLENQLQDNKTQENIKDVLEKMCTKFPSEVLTKCTQFVEKYTDAIINFVVLDLSPQEICQYLSLCPARSLPQPVHITLLKDNNGADKLSDVECELCTLVISQVYKILKKNSSEAEIKEALDKVCSYLPSKYSSKCMEFVDQYTAQIIQLIIDGMDPTEICTEIGLCTTDTLSPWATLVKTIPEKTKGADNYKLKTECELCTLVVSQVAKYFKENTSKEYVQKELDKFCGLLPGSMANECTTFVNHYTAQIIQLIIQGLDPKAICTDMELCATDTMSPWATLVKIIPEKTTGEDKLKSDAECELCEYVITKVDNILKKNKSEAYVQKELDKACDLLPGTMSDGCKTFVNQYIAQIIQLIINGTDPSEVCTLIGLCLRETSSPGATLVKIIPEKTKGMDLCPVCMIVVAELQKILKQNSTAQQVEQFLKNVCDVLPDTLTSQCHDNVDNYVPEILAQISNSLKPEKICQTVGLCNVTKTAKTDDDATLFFKPHKMVGQNKCTFGPAYWCANESNAAECGAMEHCRNRVWN